jgi:hypothetical protein
MQGRIARTARGLLAARCPSFPRPPTPPSRKRAADECVCLLGANTLLSYFHYCNKGMFPFTEACREQDLRGLAELDDNKMHYVQRTKQWVVTQSKSIRTPFPGEQSLVRLFVSP